ATLGQKLLDLALHLGALRVAERDETRLDGLDSDALLLARDLLLELLLERRHGRDADDVALAHLPEALGAQHNIQRLIPRDVADVHRGRTLDVVGRDDVDLTDVRKESENVVDVGVLEVDVDAASGIALLAAGALGGVAVGAALR